MSEYDGRQFVGIDLHRRRSVIVRMTETGVAAVPVQVFTDTPEHWRHIVRFAFCKRDEVLDEAVARLHKLSPNRDS